VTKLKINWFGWVIGAALAFPPVVASAAESSSHDVARQLNQAFVEVAEKVSRSVVVISVVQKPSIPAFDDDPDDGTYESLPPGFWRKFHQQFEQPNPEKTRSKGSGIILREDGYILTNRHVVDDAESIEVRLQDGRSFAATVRGADPQSDLAVLKIQAKDLPAAKLADSAQARVGEFALAIGAPFNLDYTVTFGHVSAKGRSNILPGYEGLAMDQDFIQTDALINPGNSGGPLVNLEGEVIGVNTLIRGMHTGIGFAIPSSLVKEIADQLVAEGKFQRAWLGVGIRALRDDPDFGRFVKGVNEGVLVTDVLANGPAAKSDLKAGDVITAVEGKSVATPQQLRSEIRGKAIGQPLSLDVYRKDKTLKVNVSPGEWVQPQTAAMRAKLPVAASNSEPKGIGITVQGFTVELAKKFGVDLATEGVVVASVEKNTPAARRGLKPGDVITAINQQPVATPKQFKEALKHAELKEGVLVNLVSGNTARFEILKN